MHIIKSTIGGRERVSDVSGDFRLLAIDATDRLLNNVAMQIGPDVALPYDAIGDFGAAMCEIVEQIKNLPSQDHRDVRAYDLSG